MIYLGVTKLAALKADEKADYIEISDEADAVVEAIKQGLEKLRISNL